MKKILVICAHPRRESYGNALASEYMRGAREAGHEVERVDLVDLDLKRFLKFGHLRRPDLGDDLREVQDLITWADHLVFFYPTWWTTPPALLKVFIEAVFHSGFAYKYQKPIWGIPTWDKLLKGKSARIMVTMDSPPIYYKFFIGDPGMKMMKGTLNFCGVRPVYKNYFGSVKMSSKKRKKKWLRRAHQIGLNE